MKNSPSSAVISQSIKIEHIRAFVAVAETESFRRGAERLRISQPTLSSRIQQLESIAGITFFDRTTRRVSLTSAGREFQPLAVRVLTDFEILVGGMADFSARRRGHVSVASVYSVATALFPEAVRRFCGSNPDVRVTIRECDSVDVARRVLRGEADFGFGARQVNEPDLDFRPVLRDRLGVAMHQDHPLIAKAEIDWGDLEAHHFIALGSFTEMDTFIRQFRPLPHAVEFPQIHVWNMPTLEALIAEGIGIAIVPELVVQHWTRAALQFRPLAGENQTREVCLVARRYRPLAPAAVDLKDIILSNLSGYAERTGTVTYLSRR